jgi:hypothetical protein
MDDFIGLQKAMNKVYDGCSPRVMVLGQERPVATDDMPQSKFPVVANLENHSAWSAQDQVEASES